MKAWFQGLKVSRSGYYAWRSRPKSKRPEWLIISDIYQHHKQKIGAPCMRAELASRGFVFSERMAYLAVFIDLFSRQVVGWQMSMNIDAKLVNDALNAALLTRGHPKNIMIHTDQGSQYRADSFIEMMKNNKLTPSMSGRGNCWDNAVAESFFVGLKKHTVYGELIVGSHSMRSRVFEYI